MKANIKVALSLPLNIEKEPIGIEEGGEGEIFRLCCDERGNEIMFCVRWKTFIFKDVMEEMVERERKREMDREGERERERERER